RGAQGAARGVAALHAGRDPDRPDGRRPRPVLRARDRCEAAAFRGRRHRRRTGGCAAPLTGRYGGSMRYAEHISELVGNTPLVRLSSVTAGLSATILAKVEYVNPGGSVK